MRRNLVLKILVLFIAILLWMQQVLQKSHEIDLQVPVRLFNLPADLVLEQTELPQFTVKIKARGYDIISTKFSTIVFQIDASEYLYGNNLVEVSEKNLSYPKRLDLQILEIEYEDNVYLKADKITEKMKPLQIEYQSSKDEEFFLENKIVDYQQKVLVKGPQSIINQIDAIKTEPVNEKMVTDGKVIVKLLVPDPRLELESDRVSLTVTQTRIINKTISLIPIKFPESENITIIPQKVSAMVSGPEDIVEPLQSHSVDAYLELDKMRRGFTGIRFELPSGVKLVEYTPQRIQVIRNE